MSDVILSGDNTLIIESEPIVTIIETEPEPEVHIINSIEVGPPGPPGADGRPGSPGSVDDGVFTGDIIRWNDLLEVWEVKSEPLEFKGIILTPAIASLIDIEGAIYYNSEQKRVLVCTDI